MLDFSLSREQESVRETIHRFAREKVRPAAAVLDRNPDPRACTPTALLREAAQLGVTAIFVPRELGGAGMGDVEAALIFEELAWGDAGLATSLSATAHTSKIIAQFGTERQKELLRRLAEPGPAPLLLGGAFTEPGSGSDALSADPRAGIQTTAVRSGDGYVLNGRKCFITNGGLASAYVVWTRTDRSKGAPDGGLSAFLVPATAPGLKIGAVEDKLGHRLSQQAELIFEDCRVSAQDLLGAEGAGFPIAIASFATTFMVVGAMSLGIARAAHEHALGYAAERIQGGSALLDHQAIGHRLADTLANIEATRALVLMTAWSNDRGTPDLGRSSMCKLLGSTTAVEATSLAVQVFGGYGYTRDYPVEKLYRDARVCPIFDGPNEIHRNGIVFGMKMAMPRGRPMRPGSA